jgi:hypothetical protein
MNQSVLEQIDTILEIIEMMPEETNWRLQATSSQGVLITGAGTILDMAHDPELGIE